MDFSVQNNLEREYFNKDFSNIKKFLHRVRESFVSFRKFSAEDIDLTGILDFKPDITQIYITLFQAGLKPLRFGSIRANLDETVKRIISKIKTNPKYKDFSVNDASKCRIMIEYVTEEIPAKLSDVKYATFVDTRFEPGITGLKLVLNGQRYYYMPNDAWINSQIERKNAYNGVLNKTCIKDLTKNFDDQLKILELSKYELFVIKSRCFITFEDNVLPLYRGNILYKYDSENIKNIALAGADWILRYQNDDGRYLYYYDAKEDNYIDHEHPTRPLDDLYYNELRHCGGIITLIRAYQLTKDNKYLEAAKKGIDFSISITQEHDYNGKIAAYTFYNKKAKLGGTGLILAALMKYRAETNDKSYDEYIKKYVRHILSRMNKTGEFMGYYIHPSYQNGEPLIEMSDKERLETFSFYYPGEALLGLALFANYFEDDNELKSEVLEKSKIALDWIVDERPKIYKNLFTLLPSDGWLMQAIEEWASNNDFRKQNYLDFVFNDAETMISKMYKADDSPYIDYEGAFYYNHGDHFFPDGARSEGLIGAYYLAKKLKNEELAEKFLCACRLNAKSQMLLANNKYNNYAHKNPEKSLGGIRFKATRQWIRVDSIQHVACFFFRLYFAEKNISVK